MVVATGMPGGPWSSHTAAVRPPAGVGFELHVDCIDSESCLAFGPGLLTSRDGGASWSNLPVPGGGDDALASCSPTGGCVVVVQPASTVKRPASDEVFVAGKLGGRWREAVLPKGTWLFSSLSCDASQCLLVGRAGSGPAVQPQLLVSAERGVSWRAAPIPSEANVVAATELGHGHWMLFATERRRRGAASLWALAYDDGRRELARDTNLGSAQLLGIACTLYPDCAALVGRGDREALVVSRDAGREWSRGQWLPPSLVATQPTLACSSSFHCVVSGFVPAKYALGASGRLATTVDGGANWSEAEIVSAVRGS